MSSGNAAHAREHLQIPAEVGWQPPEQTQNPPRLMRPGEPYGDFYCGKIRDKYETVIPKLSVLRSNKAPGFSSYSLGVGDEYFGITTQKELDKYKELTGKQNRLTFRSKLVDAFNAAQQKGKLNAFIANQVNFTEEFWKATSPQMASELRNRKSSDPQGECWRQKLLFMCLLGALEPSSSHFDLQGLQANNVKAVRKLLTNAEERNQPLSAKEIALTLKEGMDLDGKSP